MRNPVPALVSGLLFGAGLALSGMVRPEKIIGFLDVTGAFDPSLAFVMAGALLVMVPAQILARRRASPLMAPQFAVLPRLRVDRRLLAGSVLFGIGWGLSGFCPGPGIAAAGAGVRDALWFLPAMVAGMLLFRALEARSRRQVGDETGVPARVEGEPAA